MMKDNKNKNKKKKSSKNDIIFFVVVLIVFLGVVLFVPDKRGFVVNSTKGFFKEMIFVLPAVVILMGLFSEFVTKEMVIKYLSKNAGFKSVLFGIFMGALPTGPLYVAFPMAKVLLEKGASVSCIIAFLSSWACIKIPQEIIEIQFLGWQFMALRLAFTIVFVITMSYIIEAFVGDRRVISD